MRAKVATLAAFSLVLLAVAEFHAHAHPLAVLAPRKQPRKWRKIGASVAAAQRRHNHHQQRHLLAAVHDDEAHVALVLSIPQLEHSGKADSLQKQVEEALQPFIASHQDHIEVVGVERLSASSTHRQESSRFLRRLKQVDHMSELASLAAQLAALRGEQGRLFTASLAPRGTAAAGDGDKDLENWLLGLEEKQLLGDTAGQEGSDPPAAVSVSAGGAGIQRQQPGHQKVGQVASRVQTVSTESESTAAAAGTAAMLLRLRLVMHPGVWQAARQEQERQQQLMLAQLLEALAPARVVYVGTWQPSPSLADEAELSSAAAGRPMATFATMLGLAGIAAAMMVLAAPFAAWQYWRAQQRMQEQQPWSWSPELATAYGSSSSRGFQQASARNVAADDTQQVLGEKIHA